MNLRRRIAERRRDEELHATYPNAWRRGERLANNQFRDFIYVGLGQAGDRRQFEELAQSCMPEAVERWLDMTGQTRKSAGASKVDAFSRAFSLRLESLLGDYRRMPAEDSPNRVTSGVVGQMKPGSVHALVLEAETARHLDDAHGGALTGLQLQKDIAARSLYSKGATDEMSMKQVARIDPQAVAKILESDIFTGLETLTDELCDVVGPEHAQRLRNAHQAREKRLRA